MRALVYTALAAGLFACTRTEAPAPTAHAAAPAPAPASSPTFYPAAVKADPLAAKLCEALHTIPAERTAACCGSTKPTSMAGECTRLLSASLAAGAVELAAADVDACATATRRALEGCDWVTPSQPSPPRECRAILRGKIALGGACRSHLDCTGGAHCAGGRCAGPEPIGASCGGGVDQLASATRQNDVERTRATCADHCSLVTHKCEATPVIGTACFANAGCADGQSCIAGHCSAEPLGAAGATCKGATCGPDLRCVRDTCVPLAAPGEACTSDFDCARGGCTTRGDARVCAMTCSHAGDLALIAKKLGGTR